MPKFGALAYTWVGTWNKETGHKAIEKAAQAGLDLLEIPLVNADQFDADLTAPVGRGWHRGSCNPGVAEKRSSSHQS
jgi:hypothetical protein